MMRLSVLHYLRGIRAAKQRIRRVFAELPVLVDGSRAGKPLVELWRA